MKAPLTPDKYWSKYSKLFRENTFVYGDTLLMERNEFIEYTSTIYTRITELEQNKKTIMDCLEVDNKKTLELFEKIEELQKENDYHKSLFASLLGIEAWISDQEMKQLFQRAINEGLKDWKLTAAMLNKSELEKERDILEAKYQEAWSLLLPIIEWGQDPANRLPLNASCTDECLKRAKERDQAFDLLEETRAFLPDGIEIVQEAVEKHVERAILSGYFIAKRKKLLS